MLIGTFMASRIYIKGIDTSHSITRGRKQKMSEALMNVKPTNQTTQ